MGLAEEARELSDYLRSEHANLGPAGNKRVADLLERLAEENDHYYASWMECGRHRAAEREARKRAEKERDALRRALETLADEAAVCWKHTATSHQPALAEAIETARAALARKGGA